MGIHRGPNIIKDNLVFGYDTGYGIANNNTSTRFYPGRPTTNMASPDLKDWGTESGAQRIATGNYYKGQPTYNCRSAVGSHWLAIYNVVTGVRTAAGSGGTVTMSIWVKNNNPSTIITSAYMGHDFSSNRSISPSADWQRIQWTVNQSSMNSDYCEFRPNTGNSNTYLEFTMPQVEVNVGTATPWTSTSRSNTQSLIDLKRTTDIDVSNVSFDSTGQPTFDGTDDRINMGDTSLTDFGTGNFTIEAVLYIPSDITTSTGHYKGVVVKKGASGANAGMSIYYNTGHQKFLWSTANGSSSVERFTTNTFGSLLGTYIHVVMIRDSSVTNNGHFYINGVQEAITSGGSLMNVDNNYNLLVGASSTLYSPYFLEGNVPLAKIYNKALTAAEVQQNFNAYKNRFNI